MKRIYTIFCLVILLLPEVVTVSGADAKMPNFLILVGDTSVRPALAVMDRLIPIRRRI